MPDDDVSRSPGHTTTLGSEDRGARNDRTDRLPPSSKTGCLSAPGPRTAYIRAIDDAGRV
jgi:hypothetical protein